MEVQNSQRIDASKVTKPIQLLAAWLVGLILVNASFLGAAATIVHPSWAAGALVTATILNVPLFLFCLFLLQTKFRPEMQEDSYYSRHLERIYSVQTGKSEYIEVSRQIASSSVVKGASSGSAASSDELAGIRLTINDLLPRYLDIVAALRSGGVTINGTFGSTSNDPVLPKKVVFSVGWGLPVKTYQRILRIILPFGIEAVAYTSAEYAEREGYIGAYGYDENPEMAVDITPQLKSALLSPRLTQEKLVKLLDKGDCD